MTPNLLKIMSRESYIFVQGENHNGKLELECG